jgi:hypothetical protein
MKGKFKVWSNELEKFIKYPTNFMIDSQGRLHEKSTDGRFYLTPHGRYEIVFSTTKEDKNGVVWKEGDICKSLTGSNLVLIYDESEFPGWKFEYLSGITKGLKVSAHVNGLSNSEIIGNKFENPELMEGDCNIKG